MTDIIAQSLLSEEQMKLRQSGIGASEIAAVLGLSPWQSPLDVWMRKATPSRKPLVNGNIDTMPIRIGNTLEEPLRRMYERETDLVVFKPDMTFRHPLYPFILATPDGICNDGVNFIAATDIGSPSQHNGIYYGSVNKINGLEIKNVGARMASAWDDGVPDYVELQCRQNMAVLDIDTWDVAALLGGNDFQIFTVTRDKDLEESMIEAAKHFWETYILGDVPPEESDPDKRRELLAALFSGNTDKKCVAPDDAAQFDQLCKRLAEIKESEKVLSDNKKEVENALMEMVGDRYGIESEDKKYKFTWGSQRGSVSYKDIATHLADGKIAPELMEKYRADDKRVARFTVRNK